MCPTHGACSHDWRLAGRHVLNATVKAVRFKIGKGSTAVIGQIHGDSSSVEHGLNSSEWEMILKLEYSPDDGTVCAHVKTAVQAKTGRAGEIAAGPCARVEIGLPFKYSIRLSGTKLTVDVTTLGSGGKTTAVATDYDYGFLTPAFLGATTFYFKVGAYCGDDKQRLPTEGCETAFKDISFLHEA